MPSFEDYLPDAVALDTVRRVLVTKLRHHGDVLLASPVFTALRRAAPHLEVDALVYAETAPMLEGHPDIARIHTIAAAVTTTTTEVAPENNPNAMPVFWT